MILYATDFPAVLFIYMTFKNRIQILVKQEFIITLVDISLVTEGTIFNTNLKLLKNIINTKNQTKFTTPVCNINTTTNPLFSFNRTLTSFLPIYHRLSYLINPAWLSQLQRYKMDICWEGKQWHYTSPILSLIAKLLRFR